MGRGDKRTAKGKRFKHTYGVSRPKQGKQNKKGAAAKKTGRK